MDDDDRAAQFIKRAQILAEKLDVPPTMAAIAIVAVILLDILEKVANSAAGLKTELTNILKKWR